MDEDKGKIEFEAWMQRISTLVDDDGTAAIRETTTEAIVSSLMAFLIQDFVRVLDIITYRHSNIALRIQAALAIEETKCAVRQGDVLMMANALNSLRKIQPAFLPEELN